ncbi:uncharacterized protein EHS24_004668 [Apiotrichum porosum]|uniref:Uncharacterized protein n=1 Tax=Apiotrichum porosum TaxID=105984 RepID=A0A427Y5R5_9TREE|nr:uncharacterized protein EHS24_004668 [Apiotrichum porosum]RSH86418.1 hypothetical protein EHS24_004668 [Apiotrichum porosum]
MAPLMIEYGQPVVRIKTERETPAPAPAPPPVRIKTERESTPASTPNRRRRSSATPQSGAGNKAPSPSIPSASRSSTSLVPFHRPPSCAPNSRRPATNSSRRGAHEPTPLRSPSEAPSAAFTRRSRSSTAQSSVGSSDTPGPGIRATPQPRRVPRVNRARQATADKPTAPLSPPTPLAPPLPDGLETALLEGTEALKHVATDDTPDKGVAIMRLSMNDLFRAQAGAVTKILADQATSMLEADGVQLCPPTRALVEQVMNVLLSMVRATYFGSLRGYEVPTALSARTPLDRRQRVWYVSHRQHLEQVFDDEIGRGNVPIEVATEVLSAAHQQWASGAALTQLANAIGTAGPLPSMRSVRSLVSSIVRLSEILIKEYWR